MAVQLVTHRFTAKDLHRLVEAGILREDDRVELLHGEIVDMPPIGPGHAAGVNRLLNVFLPLQGERKAIISVQNPIHLGEHSEPQPDLALLKPRPDFYAQGHPTPQEVLLVVEVMESSAGYDREVKVPLYARFGIPETWLVDVERGADRGLSRAQSGGLPPGPHAKAGRASFPCGVPAVHSDG